ncbi:hypothetical protein D3C86_821790 [compost metagenome]
MKIMQMGGNFGSTKALMIQRKMIMYSANNWLAIFGCYHHTWHNFIFQQIILIKFCNIRISLITPMPLFWVCFIVCPFIELHRINLVSII